LYFPRRENLGFSGRIVFGIVDQRMSEIPRRRVLIVDDDPLITKALGQALQDDGYGVVTANGGQAGIDMFQSALESDFPFSIVITDLGMSVIDGRQVAVTVKKASPSTPVILLTGWGNWFEPETGIPASIDCVLAKPPNMRELREVLARLLKPTSP
jgi:DNA-binding response OmpR family regulator